METITSHRNFWQSSNKKKQQARGSKDPSRMAFFFLRMVESHKTTAEYLIKVNDACVFSPDLGRRDRDGNLSTHPHILSRFLARILQPVMTVTFLGFLRPRVQYRVWRTRRRLMTRKRDEEKECASRRVCLPRERDAAERNRVNLSSRAHACNRSRLFTREAGLMRKSLSSRSSLGDSCAMHANK